MKTSILHIGKTGGTALKEAIGAQLELRDDIDWHGHGINLKKLWKKFPKRQVIFGVRDPTSRFVSGFNSRLRQGRPRYDYRWSPQEKILFEYFPDANVLAEALSSSNRWERGMAELAMNNIRHVSDPLSWYLNSIVFLKKHREKIRFVYTQETLAQDLDKIKDVLELPGHIRLPVDDISGHRTPPSLRVQLSERGEDNVIKWYGDDYILYDYCRGLYHS